MLSILEVCHLTGKSEKTVYRMMNNGKLPYTQIDGKRFAEKEDVLKLLPNKHEIEKRDYLEQKISVLTNEVIRLSGLIELLVNSHEKNKNTAHPLIDNVFDDSLKKQPKISSNEIRAKKAKIKLFESLDKLNKNNKLPMYRGLPSVTGIHRITGIDRGTISKYIKEWMDSNS